MNAHPYRVTVTIEHQLPDISCDSPPLRYSVSADCDSEDVDEVRRVADGCVLGSLAAAGFAVNVDDDGDDYGDAGTGVTTE
jgi:hypothetical protein